MRIRLPRIAPLLLVTTAAPLPGVPVTPLEAQGPAPIDIPFERHVLPNGLTLIIHEDHKAPIVAVNVWYHVGSKNERPGRTGFAHLFEHLMFNGSENHDDEYFGPLQQVGVTDINGTTNEDRTNYFQNVPTNALDLALFLESDRMGHLLGAITQARLDEQRGVVQNEKRQGEDQPYGRVWDFLTPRVFPPNHPYSWTAIGSMEDLGAAKLDDVKEWFRTYYGPANAVLVIAGRREPGRREGPGREILRRHPVRTADHPPGSVGRQAHRQPARTDVRPGAAGPGVQGVERAGLGHGRRGAAQPHRQSALGRQVVAALQAAGVRRADRDQRQRLRRPARDRRALRRRGDRAARPGPGEGRARRERGARPVPRRRSRRPRSCSG